MGIVLLNTWSPTLLPVVIKLVPEATVYTAQPFSVSTMGIINHFMLALYGNHAGLSSPKASRGRVTD